MLKSMIEYVAELRPFFNHKEVPVSDLVKLLGKQRPSAMVGGMRLSPYDKRFTTVLVRMDPRNPNILLNVAFACPENAVGLGDLIEKFGPFQANWDEKENETVLRCVKFEEEESIESLNTRIERFQMENAEGGLLLHRPGDSPVVVPESEILLPHFSFSFKPFERPVVAGAAGKGNPMQGFQRK